MSRGTVTGLVLLAIIIVHMILAMASAKTELSYPEEGITCIEIKNIYNHRIPAGCFTGDVTKPGNKLNTKATNKYQGEHNE